MKHLFYLILFLALSCLGCGSVGTETGNPTDNTQDDGGSEAPAGGDEDDDDSGEENSDADEFSNFEDNGTDNETDDGDDFLFEDPEIVDEPEDQ